MTWSQNYAPLGNLAGSAAVAALPVLTLLGLLAFLRVRAYVAALAGLAVAGGVAVLVYGMPLPLAGAAAAYGAAFGLFPIGWIVLNAIFIYNLSVETGGFAILQRQVAGISCDQRIQALMIAFSFGAFIEGAAGFGAPAAITGALMIGLGFRPLEAAKLALIGNTAPVAFAALGTPLVTLAKVTNLDLLQLTATVGTQLAVFALIVPFVLVAAMSGWRGMRGVWPACLITGVSFATAQYLVSRYHGPWLVSIIAPMVSMTALMILMRFWQPAGEQGSATEVATITESTPTPGIPRWHAWLPWAFLSVSVFIWGLPPVKGFLNGLFETELTVPMLHQSVLRMPPVVAASVPEPAVFTFNLLSATGTSLLLAGVLAGLCLRVGPVRMLRVYGRTLWQLSPSLLTIAVMMALGFTTRYGGADTTMGLALASTGVLFPFFSPLIGWLGVAVTGSDTSANVLFGNLQQVTAQRLDLPPVLMVASNSSGGVMGKMISAQSIVVACMATAGRPNSPSEGTLLRSVFRYSVVLALLMGVLVVVQAYVIPWLFPGGLPSLGGSAAP